MNRKLLTTLVFSLVCLFIIAGCSGDSSSEKTGNNSGDNSSEKTANTSGASLKMAVGGSGGGWYVAGSAMVNEWEKAMEDLSVTLVPGGGLANPTRVNQGQEDIGFTYVTNALAAKDGVGSYDEAHENLRGMINLNVQNVLTMMVLDDVTDEKYIDKVIEGQTPLKINPGPRGSGSEETIRLIFSLFDASYDELEEWGGKVEFGSPDDAVNQLRNGQMDAYSAMTPLGNAATVDLALSRDVNTLGLSEELRETLVNDYGYIETTIPEGTYEGIDQDVPTVANSVNIIVNKNVLEDTVYNLVKVLVEKIEELKKVHSMFEDFNLENVADMPIDLHPGAEKYFEENDLK